MLLRIIVIMLYVSGSMVYNGPGQCLEAFHSYCKTSPSARANNTMSGFQTLTRAIIDHAALKNSVIVIITRNVFETFVYKRFHTMRSVWKLYNLITNHNLSHHTQQHYPIKGSHVTHNSIVQSHFS